MGQSSNPGRGRRQGDILDGLDPDGPPGIGPGNPIGRPSVEPDPVLEDLLDFGPGGPGTEGFLARGPDAGLRGGNTGPGTGGPFGRRRNPFAAK